MDRTSTRVAIFFLLLLIAPMCTAFRISASIGRFGRVPAVVRGDDELKAVIDKQYHALQQHLISPTAAAADGSDGHGDACRGLDGSDLAHCQRHRFERFLAGDYQDAEPNVNVMLAPLPA